MKNQETNNNYALRLVRLRGDWSLKDVAENVGISQSALISYESGKRLLRDEIKQKLADYYNVDIRSLFAEYFNSSYGIRDKAKNYITIPVKTAAALLMVCTNIDEILSTGEMSSDIMDEFRYLQPFFG